MVRQIRSLAVAAMLAGVCACGDDDNDTVVPTCSTDAPAADVTGDWLVHDLVLTSSDCDGEVDDILQEAIASTNDCRFAVTQDGANVTAVDCGENVWAGCVNAAGDVSIGLDRSESDLGCTVQVGAVVDTNLIDSPTSGRLTLNVDFSGTCVFEDDCTAVVEGIVTREVEGEVLPAADAGGALPDALLNRLLAR